MRNDLCHEDVTSRLTYDPETGIFKSKRSGMQVGMLKKGARSGRLYVRIKVKDVFYGAHRLAWLYVTGAMPDAAIDHRNGDSTDNRFSNLRLATLRQNSCNAPSKSRAHGLPRGVVKYGNRFGIQIRCLDRRIQLKGFATADLAAEFYQLAAEMINGDFAYHLGAGATHQGDHK